MRPMQPVRGFEMRTLTMLLVSVCGAGLAWASDDTFERTVAADPHGSVEISNVSGKIEVSAWDNPQVQVRAEHSGGPDNIRVESDHGHVSIRVMIPGASSGWHGTDTDLQVKVPRESELDASG